MFRRPSIANIFLLCCATPAIHAREWTDATGSYTLEAELAALNDRAVILQRADGELGLVPIELLSESDREFLKSKEASDASHKFTEPLQTWTLQDGTKLVGRIVDYAAKDLTLQRRRGNIYVNDRNFDNLPDFYKQLLPPIVAKTENLQRADRRSLQAWLVRQRGEPRTIRVEGVIIESENGDEYGVPFFLLSDEDQTLLQSSWDDWKSIEGKDAAATRDDLALALQALAAARQQNETVNREVATLKLYLQALQAGVTSLWEVTLHPIEGQSRPPLWVVVPGRDSRQATATALQQHPGYAAGPVRRVSRR
jgi:hypothetical protein